MYWFTVALVVTLVGTAPLFFQRKVKRAAWVGGLSILPIWAIVYLATPSTTWPLFGLPGFLVFIGWIVSAIVDGLPERRHGGFEGHWIWAFPVIPAVLYLGNIMLGSGIMRANDYMRMAGQVEPRVWTQDVQPKDPKHMRMRSRENAIYLAKKILGDAGPIGSQFNISEDHMTLQMIGNELWYVVPLDYNGFSVWASTDGVPGYVMIHGEDPHEQPRLVMLKDKKFRYMPGAFFGDQLERHMRSNGYFNRGLAEFQFD